MQTRDETVRNCLEFSQPLSCLYQAMQTRKTFSIAFINNIPHKKKLFNMALIKREILTSREVLHA